MTTRATGTFDIDAWDGEAPDERDGVTLSRAHLTKTFRGDVEGTSTTDILMAGGREEGSAAYVALERIDARVHGRRGSFVLQHSATSSRGQQSATWTVVPDTGTGELLGLRGTAEIEIEPDGTHRFRLDYDLG